MMRRLVLSNIFTGEKVRSHCNGTPKLDRLTSLICFTTIKWSQVCMPTFSASMKVMLETNYEIVQMDEELLLLVVTRDPYLTKRRVYVYQYKFADQRWSALPLFTTPIIPIPKPISRGISFNAVARGGLLILSIQEMNFICSLNSNTWRNLPPCYNPRTGSPILISKVACALDPVK
ncbi:hypothetical protein GOP47_0001572 [Adiantum capillus-veneris]|uniref:Uncharacterized protein n=1 Tax=Adiantum capillus-veneris TaxID=13818 RepID=A0A9D4V975_ADICA|nr:hypothetical protein GOP47_0001572 [Adiantum capillus-veneris]